MWRISDLKKRGRTMMHLNYWRAVLVAMVLTVAVGAGSVASGSSSAFSNYVSRNISSSTYGGSYNSGSSYYNDDDFLIGGDNDIYYDGIEEYGMDDDIINDYVIPYTDSYSYGFDGMLQMLIRVFVIIMIILVVLLILSIIVDILLLNPLEVGANRFFYRSLYEKAGTRELMYGFDNNYKNVIKVMFFRSLYNLLWYFALMIPGIVKSYEYAMIPYLLGEYPDMPQEDAFAISRYMMDGNKWEAFLLDLSFIGWDLLALIPFVGMFYVHPYKYMTRAALYDTLKEKKRPFANTQEPENPFAAQEQDPYTAAPENAGYPDTQEQDLYSAPSEQYSVPEDSSTYYGENHDSDMSEF